MSLRLSSTAIVILVGSIAALPPNIMPILSAQLVETFSLKDTQLGYFVAAGTIAGAIASLTAPFWVTRVRIVWAVLGSLAIYAGAIHALPSVSGTAALYSLQFLLGGCLVVVSSVCSSVLLRRPNPARVMSLKISCDVLIASAFLMCLPVADLGLAGLVKAISLCFVVGLFIACFWPRHVSRLDLSERAIERVTLASGTTWWVLLTLVVFYTAGVSGWNYLGRLALSAGLDTQQSASAIASGLLVGIVGSLGAATLAGRFRSTLPETLSGIAFVGSLAALGSVKGFAPFLVAVLLFNVSWNFFIPFLMGLLAVHDHTGRLSTLLPATAMLGGVLGPPMTGNLIEVFSYGSAMNVMAGMAALSIAGYVLLGRVRKAGRKAGTQTALL